MIRSGRQVIIPGDFMGVRAFAPKVAAPAGDWWEVTGKTCLLAYQPKGAASLAASYSNLANPGTNDAAPGTAPDFDASTGWTFNGSSQYLNTGLEWTSGDYTVLVRFSDFTSGTTLTGVNNVTQMRVHIQGGVRSYNNGAASLSAGSGTTGGVMGIAAGTGYYNGSSDGSLTGATGSTAIYTIYIGARNNSATAGNFAAAKIQAYALYSATLTAGEVAVVSSAMSLL